jgi:hypothetical protein
LNRIREDIRKGVFRIAKTGSPSCEGAQSITGLGFQMTSISSIALSGMNAAQSTLNASAHNIANLNTSDFGEQERATLTTATEIGSSLEKDVVAQLQAKNSFLANLAVFKTSDKMAGALLNLKV